MIRSLVFVTGGMSHLGIAPKSVGAGWRVRTPGRPQSAALFAARCISSGVTLVAKVENGAPPGYRPSRPRDVRTVVICRSGKLARGARKLLSMLLSDDEFLLLQLYGVTRRTLYGTTKKGD